MSLATLKTSITVNKQTTALYPVIFVYQLVVLIQKKGGIGGFFVHEFFPVLTSILKDEKTWWENLGGHQVIIWIKCM